VKNVAQNFMPAGERFGVKFATSCEFDTNRPSTFGRAFDTKPVKQECRYAAKTEEFWRRAAKIGGG